MRFRRTIALAAVGTAAISGAGLAAAAPAWASRGWGPPFISHFHHTKLVASTVPRNGDLNPYGIAVVQQSQGRLVAGDVLISNFNNKKNLQGTGTTIVQVSPGGKRTVFAHVTRSGLPGRCPGGIGLTTALVIVNGWVIVGDLPSRNGMAATASGGCLLVLDSHGTVRKIFRGHGIRGPWDATAVSDGDSAELFVANVLNGTIAAKGAVVHRGTVLRLNISFAGSLPAIQSVTKVGSGFAEQTNASAFVFGPTGLGIGAHGTLYVADTQNSQITRIPGALHRNSSAGTGKLLTSGGFLNEPLGMTIAPNGDVLTVNGGNGRIVETSPSGHQVASRFLDRSGSPPGSGALFGLTLAPNGSGVYYVDDAQNTLRLLS